MIIFFHDGFLKSQIVVLKDELIVILFIFLYQIIIDLFMMRIIDWI